MDSPLDEQYLTWLYARIGSVRERQRSKTYWILLRHLYIKEFVWFIPNDDNRVEDGRDLRLEFLDEMELPEDTDPEWMSMRCSVLELILGLANRLAFETDRTQHYWFWHLLRNLKLHDVTDDKATPRKMRYVDEVVDALIWRTYEPDGRGGLFPMQEPSEDQRDVELWYQLCAYILDRV